MDESMNSVHSISAMDISPACSPKSALSPIPSNHLILNAFQQQQELLSNMLFSAPSRQDFSISNKNPISEEHELNSNSMCLFSTVLSDNHGQAFPDDTTCIRQRTVTKVESVPTVVDSMPTAKTCGSKSPRQGFSKLLLSIPLLICFIYLTVQYFNTPLIVLPRASSWQNASEYLTQNLIGQDQGLREFKDAMDKHKNFSIVLIEGPTGTGKTYLASSLGKFVSTTLLSANTLLGLPKHHWIESDRLATYLLSYLSPASFQYLIIDDLDLLMTDETYCQTLATALHSINDEKNLFILLLKTTTTNKFCSDTFNSILTKSIQFHMLQREHIRTCIQNEARTQNVQPPLNNQQIDKILSSLKYTHQEGLSYGVTGCKRIPSLVMLATKKNENW
ncbi:unnamed protein product [Adineta ricciae]|uniref:ATPase AAA-type core domain-containing protein n=1 Tax=Adineta ricciae TaxID=249248 RepID=A0A813S4T6_ADIRI|nr:unnamed protein product [Adineta ricciae]CAF1252289.1 unnamed protein product [Adineta ricciae]